jgi:asparagine N-glycosylation enzyme membrane subunit Stt3
VAQSRFVAVSAGKRVYLKAYFKQTPLCGYENNKKILGKVSHLIAKRFIILAVAAVIIIAAVVAVSFQPQQVSTDDIGGRYNALVTHYTDRNELTYTDEAGQHALHFFDDNLKPALQWINSSTPENVTVLCWWDYGHMVKAVGERNVVVRNPSQEIISSVGDPSSIKEFDPNSKILDAATAYTTSNASQTQLIMEKYNATYILVEKDDPTKAIWMYRISGLNETDYVTGQGFTDLGQGTMIARLLDNRDTSGFTQVYSDTYMKIYRVPTA